MANIGLAQIIEYLTQLEGSLLEAMNPLTWALENQNLYIDLELLSESDDSRSEVQVISDSSYSSSVLSS